jgi:uncharacterized damage-inducible protein DinB
MGKIVDYNNILVSKVNNYFVNLNDSYLKKVYRINNDGIRRKYIARDVLLHILTEEELHHRGEIMAILWQQDLQPPDMGWLSVMRKRTDPIWDMK